MSRLDNLRPFNTMLPEEHRALSVRGGVASGAARRAKREQINQAKLERIAAGEISREMACFLRRGLPQMKSCFRRRD